MYHKNIGKAKNKHNFVIPKNITNIRRNMPEKYFLFALHFIAPVVGKKKFDNYKTKFGMSKFVSVNDETFALLVFENNYDQ